MAFFIVPPIASLSREETSTLVRAHAAYAIVRAYEYRMYAEDEGFDQPALMAASRLAWLTATLWLEIERFACR